MINNIRNKMDDSDEKMSTGHGKKLLNPFAVKKPKKRSVVERELETNMTALITSPVSIGDGASTSRYGRARRIKPGIETGNIFETLKSPKSENTPVKTQSPITKLAPTVFKTETPKKALETASDNINTIQDRKSMSRFNSPVLPKCSSSAKKFPKVYIRTDLIQNRDDDDDDVIMIKDLFSPKSGKIQNKALKRSAERLNISLTKQNGHIDNTSVVKALNFDGNKSKKDFNSNKRKSDGNKKDSANFERESKIKKRYSDGNKKTDSNKRDLSNKINSDVIKKDSVSKTDLSNKTDSDGNNGDLIGNKRDFDGNKNRKVSTEIQFVKTEMSKVESSCPYQVGDLAWARMGTFPFWPCIITKDPESDMFVRKKLFGRVEHYILHVNFFADNGRRSWVVDNMLRKYSGLDEFLSTREKFTAQDKKKYPRQYSAFFISEKKQSLWNTSVEEAETLNREPQDLRIDIFNDLLYQSRASKKQKSGRITRTDSDVSLSESLYDSLFSQEDNQKEDGMRLRNKSKNRSLDVSDVVTACLDNMAAKTGNIKIQRQSHMDRWLQKAKTKTPEKVKNKDPPKTPIVTPKVETVTPIKVTPIIEKVITPKVEVTKEKPVSNNKKKKLPPKEVKITKVYSLRRSYESQNAFCEAENKIDSKDETKVTSKGEIKSDKNNIDITDSSKTEPMCDSNKEKPTDDCVKNLDTKFEEPKDKKSTCNDDSEDVLKAINELLDDSSTTETNSLPKPAIALQESKETEVKLSDHEQDLKPEVMEVDETDDSKVEDKNKPTETAKVNLDSPVKTDKNSAEKEVVDGSLDELDCSVITRSSVETKLTVPSDIQAKDAELNITIDTINTTITSSHLKSNEMVSIPDNIDMTDDDDDKSIKSKEYSVDLQDHNSNLTNASAVKSQVANTLEKAIDTKKTESEILDSGTDVTTTKHNETALAQKLEENSASETLPEEQEVTIQKPVNVISSADNKNISTTNNEAETEVTENHDMSIDEIKGENVTTNEKDLLNQSGQSASILQVDDAILCDKDNTEKYLLLNITEKTEDNLLNKSGESASILQLDDECKNVNPKEELSLNNTEKTEDNLLNENGQSASILQIDDEVCVKDSPKEEMSLNNDEKTEDNLLNKSGESASILQLDDECKNVNPKEELSLNNTEKTEDNLLNENGQSASILQIDDEVCEKDSPKEEMSLNNDEKTEDNLLNKSGESASILQINDVTFEKDNPNEEPPLTDNAQTNPIIETCNNDKLEVNPEVIKSDDVAATISYEPNYFLGNCHSMDVKNTEGDDFFRKDNIKLPPDLTTESKIAKAVLLNVQDIDSDYEDSDDEPSPEYEPLGDEITEDFRQYMKCIESNITDKKDEAQLVKVCNDIAILEESKAKLIDIKTSMTKVCNLNMSEYQIKEEQIKSKSYTDDTLKSEKAYIEPANIDLTKSSDDCSKDVRTEILDGLNIINKAAENSLKSPLDKKKHKLSLKRNKSYISINTLDDTVNPQYKTIDQIEEIMKSKPKRPPIENGEINIPEIKENGYHSRVDTPEQFDDDFDIEEASVNSEDSEISLPQERIPARRSLRARPCKKSGLEDPEFLTYMELRQDDLMEEHPELSMDDIVLYLYKTFTYTQNLKSNAKIEESPILLKTVKQETQPSKKKSKKTVQPKNTIENFFREKYKNAKKIDFDSERSESFGTDSEYKKRLHSISPVDSGIGNSKDSNESDTSTKRHSNKSPQIDLSKDITKCMKVELINDIEHNESIPRRHRKKTVSPKVLERKMSVKDVVMAMNKRVPVVVISPIKNERLETKKHETKPIYNNTIIEVKEESKEKPIVITTPELDNSIKHEDEPKSNLETNDTEAIALPNVETTDKEPIVITIPEIDNNIKHEDEPKPNLETNDTEAIAVPNVETTDKEPIVITTPELDNNIKHEDEPKPNLVTNDTEAIAVPNVETTDKEPIVITIPEIDNNIKHEDEPKPNLETNVTEAKAVPNVETDKEVEEVIHNPDSTCVPETIQKKEIKVDIEMRNERDTDTESMDSDSELPLRQLRSKVLQENKLNELKNDILEVQDEIEETASVNSDNEPLLKLRPKKVDKSLEGSYEDPEFLKYVELKQDNLIDDNPDLTPNEIKAYLYKTWIYEKDSKTDIQKNDDIASSNLVKGLNQEKEAAPTRRKRKPKTEKFADSEEIILKDKPKRKTVSHYYNEAFISDIEDELEVFEIFKTKKSPLTVVSKSDSPKKEAETKTEEPVKNETEDVCEEINTLDEVELYFKQLTSPKPSVFKGLIREKVCEICEDISNLIKCKGCNGTFHFECVTKNMKTVDTPTTRKGRKKKIQGRKAKNLDISDHSDERDISEENISFEEPLQESITIDAATIEAQIEAKMKEILEKQSQVNNDSYSSDEEIDWSESIPGKCELIDVKLKLRTPPIDYANFKCNNCQKHSTPVCFVCKSAVSKTDVKIRQKCNVAHCHNYYHLQCLDHWPQTQFNAGEWSKSSKKAEQLEALTCPRHVCHTCVSDDPRGCKTRFSGDKLAKCVRCPATYHSFNKCLPAGTQILTASLIICPRHENRPGKVPYHVNTAWCFICALGGSLICCEYCPTSFHAECLNIKPPEGNYMCEDCETGRLPLYGEMVWVKLGAYRWWPGIVLHPSEIPDNIMAVKHGIGEFVVRFFGQYDHYWVNRGRVFPYQEGDSGRISSQKSRIDLAFTTAMEHAQRAFEILKNAQPDEEESLDIASSLLPPHYVKLKCNKPIGSLLGRKIEDPSLSLTQCECNPAEAEPCGPNSQCINRMLLTECGPTCRAGDRCSNRAFEKRLYPKLTPYRAAHRGWGLKTLEDIRAGQFVIEYVGELIDEEEFQRRMRRKHEIRDENFYFLTLDKERMIDAGPKGNLARFMNHCCEPNCETQKWTVLGDVRVGLFAIDDIKANSEVTFNYNLECTGIEKKQCMCGAKRCSGYIGAKPKQLDESQRKKNGLTKRKYTKRKNLEESPSTSSSKNKVKKPVGRPPKPKELTEIEKDLLIIKNATVPSGEICQSAEENKNKNNDYNTINEASNLSDIAKKLDSNVHNETELIAKIDSKNSKIDSEISKIDSSSTFLNDTDVKTLKRKLDPNTQVINEPSAKRLKCDKQIEVGD